MGAEVRHRWPLFDSAKFVLILLVIFGHTFEQYGSLSAVQRGIYFWIYSFHMPVFVFISGRFSKAVPNRDQMRTTVRRVLVPLIIAQVAYYTFNFLVLGKPIVLGEMIQKPYWILWYLLSLFFWRVFLPYLHSMKHPLLIACTLGLLAGYSKDINYTLSLGRTFAFFPFFVLGHYTSAQWIECLRRPIVQLLSGALLLAGMYGIYLYQNSIQMFWFYASLPYSSSIRYTIDVRAFHYMYAVITCYAVLAVLPTWRWLAALGRNSLYPYILHGFWILLFAKYKLFAALPVYPMLGVALLVGILLCAGSVYIPKIFIRTDDPV